MKVLYLHPRSWIGEYAMLVHLRRLGHEVCVLEESRDLPAARRLDDHFEKPGDGIPTFWYNPRRGGERALTWLFDRYYRKAFDGRNLVHRMWVIAAAARHFRPDVIVASDGFSYAVPAAFLRRFDMLGAPLVAGFIGGDILDCPEAAYGRRRTPATDRLIKCVVRHADRLRPVSPMLVDVLLGDGADARRISMIPSHLVFDAEVIDAVFGARKDLGVAIRRRYGIAPGAPMIATLSWNQKGKGAHVLAEAWPRILAAVPGARWLLCGPEDPWLAKAVWPVLEQAGVRDSVVATGRLAGRDIFEHLAAADLHVNPTLCEGLNMVTVEAAAVGTPTICTDGCGVAAWIEKSGAGAVVPAAAAAPLADATIRALQDPALLSACSAASRRMIADFMLDRVAEQLIALFQATCREAPQTES
jgi:glycosyltransferase involved in cell wall biosynthesis